MSSEPATRAAAADADASGSVPCRAQLDAILDQFEEAWQARPFPELAAFLGQLSAGMQRRQLLTDLIKIDLDQRWRCRQTVDHNGPVPARPRLEDYVAAFPELGAVAALPVGLIREEYWVRHIWGDRPAAEEFFARFSAQEKALRGALAAADAELALEPSHSHTGRQTLPGSADTQTERRLGPYLLLEPLGAGVTGQVFKARDEASGHVVALKLIRPELLTAPDAVRRFYHEIEAVRRLAHPNVVRACAAGAAENTHFLAMEYFEGYDLDRLVKQSGPLPAERAREYVRQAALGLQHIHEHGLIHRDLKPANLLLAQVPGEVGDGVVKILDLGLARLGRDQDDPAYSTLTREGTVMGTPDYMAPEQATDAHTADARADLYSLGCTLYYLLAGKPPFSGGTLIQKTDRHRWEEPAAIEKIRADIPPGLLAVLYRLLSKSPQDRLASAAEVARALEPDARPLSRPRSTGAWPTPVRERRRARLPVLALACLLAVLAVIVGMATTRKSGPVELPAPATPFDARVAAGIPEDELSVGMPPEVVAVLGDQRLRQWSLVWSVGFDPAGDRVASAGEERTIRFWDPRTGREVMTVRAPHHVYSIAYSPDGQLLASGGLGSAVVLWDARSGRERLTIRKRVAVVRAVAFTPDSQTVIAADHDTVVLWDVLGGKVKAEWPIGEIVYALGCSRDGRTLAASTADGRVRLWDLQAGKERAAFSCGTGAIRALAFAHDNVTLVVGADNAVKLLDTVKGGEPEILGRFQFGIRSLVFSRDGRTFASGGDGDERSIALWDMKTRRMQAVLRPRHERAREGVFSLAFSPDGSTLASGSPDGGVRIWNMTNRTERFAVPPTWPVDALAVSADGSTVALGSRMGPGRLWDVAAGSESILEVPGVGSPTVAAAPLGPLGVFCGNVGITSWNASARQPGDTIAAPGLLLLAAAYAPDGLMLATGSGDHFDRTKPGELKLWDLTSGKGELLLPGHHGAVSALAFGKVASTPMLISGGGDGVIAIWDPARRAELSRLPAHGKAVRSLALAADGRLASSGEDGMIKLWQPADLKEYAAPLRAKRGRFVSVAWNPAGTRLAACDSEGGVCIWDTTTWTRLLVRDMPGPVNQVAFSPDGRFLLTGNGNGTVYVIVANP